MSTNYAPYQQRRSEAAFDDKWVDEFAEKASNEVERLMRKQRRKDYAIAFTISAIGFATFALGSRFGSSKK